MIIQNDFSHKVIVSAVGEIQIKLLILIYKSIEIHTGKINHALLEEAQIYKKIKKAKLDNLRPELLYFNNRSTLNMSNATCWTRQKLQTFYEFGSKANFDETLVRWNNKHILSEYKLINMKQFIDLYGKYIFNNDINIRDKFINDYPELANCNVMKVIKQIPF